MSVMSSTVKTKFAGLLRGLLRRLDERKHPRPQRRASSTQQRGAPPGATPVTVSVSHSAPTTTMPRRRGPAAPGAEDDPDALNLPLQPILAALTMDLRAKVMQAPPPDALISIPLEKILTQLAFGSVKVTFGELRQAAPGLFVNSGGEHDSKPVTLPLNEILTRLNPARLARRTSQKHIEVADDITGPFGPGGQGAKVSTNTKPTPSTTLTQRTTAQSLRMVAPAVPPPATPTPVAPPPPAFVPRTVAPASASPLRRRRPCP